MSGGYSNVLVPLDFSSFSEKAARRAAEIAKATQARLTLLHVVDYFPEDVPLEVVAPEDRDPAEYLEARAKSKLADLARQIGDEGAVCTVTFSTHSARHEIVRVANEQGMDLIVVGSHGRRGLTEYLGSTTHGVIHGARCDVLIVRSQ